MGMMDWQPIETAPTDVGLLLWARSDNTERASCKIGEETGWDPAGVHICAYESTDPEGTRVFYSTEKDGWGEREMRLWATHWMPLPAAPASTMTNEALLSEYLASEEEAGEARIDALADEIEKRNLDL
jgi:hypothetical protein